MRRLRPEETTVTNEAEAAKRAAFDAAVKEGLGDLITPAPDKPMIESMDPFNNFDYDNHEDDKMQKIVSEADAIDSRGTPVNQQYVADLLINAEVLLPHDDAKQMAKVIRRSIDTNGNIIGDLANTPSLNKLVYDVEFPDGAVKPYAANVIAENLLTQVDPKGSHSHSLDKIILHQQMNNALSHKDAYVTIKRGVRRMRQTTIGWKFLCEFKDGSNNLVSLKVLKESHLIEVAEYVTALDLETEPAFSWWVPYTLKKRD